MRLLRFDYSISSGDLDFFDLDYFSLCDLDSSFLRDFECRDLLLVDSCPCVMSLLSPSVAIHYFDQGFFLLFAAFWCCLLFWKNVPAVRFRLGRGR